MLWRRLLKTLKDGPAEELNLGAGAAFTVIVRVGGYALIAVGGIVVARALGAHDRGVYSLVTTIGLMFAAFAELGVSKAGIYFVGQKRYSFQEVTSNNLAWWLAISGLWVAGAMAVAATRPFFVPDVLHWPHFVIFAIGGSLLLLFVFTTDLLITSGSLLGYNLIMLAEALLRTVLVIGGVVLLGFGIVGVLSAWLLGIALAAALAAYLLMKRARLVPRIEAHGLRDQLSFGIRSNLGYILQAANERLDVFLVAGIAGAAALGHYAVAFGLAEVLWRIPFALGAVFFPKVAALDPESNADTAAATCRRALFITLLATLAMLPAGHVLISSLYGHEFLPAVTAFYILAPSAMLYTIFRVLGSSLAARGMPESSIYGGAVSVPVTIALGLLLIPRLGIEGAAIASIAAYGASAAVVLVLFVRVTGRSVWETLVINRLDISSSVDSAKTLLARSEASG